MIKYFPSEILISPTDTGNIIKCEKFTLEEKKILKKNLAKSIDKDKLKSSICNLINEWFGSHSNYLNAKLKTKETISHKDNYSHIHGLIHDFMEKPNLDSKYKEDGKMADKRVRAIEIAVEGHSLVGQFNLEWCAIPRNNFGNNTSSDIKNELIRAFAIKEHNVSSIIREYDPALSTILKEPGDNRSNTAMIISECLKSYYKTLKFDKEKN
jgi:hypothetical protein